MTGVSVMYIVIHLFTCAYLHLHSNTAETSSKIRTLERSSKTLKNEKALLQEEVSSLRDQVAEKDKELRGVKSELREVQDETSRLSEKLSDVQAQKKKFSRLAREKAEEMGERERERGRGGGRREMEKLEERGVYMTATKVKGEMEKSGSFEWSEFRILRLGSILKFHSVNAAA